MEYSKKEQRKIDFYNKASLVAYKLYRYHNPNDKEIEKMFTNLNFSDLVYKQYKKLLEDDVNYKNAIEYNIKYKKDLLLKSLRFESN